MTKAEIIIATQNVFHHFTEISTDINETFFFERSGANWSIAENIQHLILSINTTTLAYQLPKFLVRWIGGKPNRNSYTFDKLLARYNKKLEDGAKASARYVPKPIHIKYGKKKLLDNWNKVATKLINTLNNFRPEEDLDDFLVKHPLLGRITLRELCYFTIFHTSHHLESIQTRKALSLS